MSAADNIYVFCCLPMAIFTHSLYATECKCIEMAKCVFLFLSLLCWLLIPPFISMFLLLLLLFCLAVCCAVAKYLYPLCVCQGKRYRAPNKYKIITNDGYLDRKQLSYSYAHGYMHMIVCVCVCMHKLQTKICCVLRVRAAACLNVRQIAVTFLRFTHNGWATSIDHFHFLFVSSAVLARKHFRWIAEKFGLDM